MGSEKVRSPKTPGRSRKTPGEEGVPCFCPRCGERFSAHLSSLEAVFEAPVGAGQDEVSGRQAAVSGRSAAVELEGGEIGELDSLEELRRVLVSFLRPGVLTALNDLKEILCREPRMTEQAAWFVRNALDGERCRYYVLAVKKFREQRLEKVLPLLKRSLAALEKLKDS